nr:hypothetical protein CFP56_48049 [Quercus suber]
MDPEQGRAFGDVVDCRFEELAGDGGEYDEASAFDREELSGVGAAVASDLATRGVPDSKELGEEGGGTGDPTVVSAKLDGEEDDDAGPLDPWLNMMIDSF